MPLSSSSRCERKRVSEWKSPSGPPAEAPMSPWVSSTMKVSSCLSVRRGRAAECGDRRAARHGFDHGCTERLRPVYREQERCSFAEEFCLFALIDLAYEHHPWLSEQRRDGLAEIGLIDLVHLGRDLE